jgi:hypothetical protein
VDQNDQAGRQAGEGWKLTPAVRAAVLDFDLLTGVLARVVDGLNEPDSLQFQFERGALRISADADSDSVLASVAVDADGFCMISESEPWASLVGGKVTSAWALENNYEYEDGLELEIALVTGEEILLRLVVIASTIHASLVSINFLKWVGLDG